MKNFILFILIFSSINSFAQDYELPKMKWFKYESYAWKDSITANQIKLYSNGNLKLDYVNIGNSKKIRREYFEEGGLKLTIEVKQKYRVDSVYDIDPITGISTLNLYSGYRDIPDGKYIEYKKPFRRKNKSVLITYGNYLNGKMQGKWETMSKNLVNKITATYNSEGYLDGEYIEFYDTRYFNKEIIKWKGTFKVFKSKETILDPITGKLETIISSINERFGTWTLYDMEGKIICEVNYSWKN